MVSGAATVTAIWKAIPASDAITSPSRLGEVADDSAAASWPGRSVPHARRCSATAPPADCPGHRLACRPLVDAEDWVDSGYRLRLHLPLRHHHRRHSAAAS